jgi:polyisoprenoid-binding protein YceI
MTVLIDNFRVAAAAAAAVTAAALAGAAKITVNYLHTSLLHIIVKKRIKNLLIKNNTIQVYKFRFTAVAAAAAIAAAINEYYFQTI